MSDLRSDRRKSMVGKSSPWGKIQAEELVTDGIWIVSTPSHGGFKLDREANAGMPAELRLDGGWYEEDCAWSHVVVAYPTLFSEDKQRNARTSLRDWEPDLFESFFGEPVKPGESVIRDQETFDKKHQDDFVVTAAYGDWAGWVPSGFVGVLARKGGRNSRDGEERYFLVPEQEYDARGKFSFVVELGRHTPVDKAAVK